MSSIQIGTLILQTIVILLKIYFVFDIFKTFNLFSNSFDLFLFLEWILIIRGVVQFNFNVQI